MLASNSSLNSSNSKQSFGLSPDRLYEFLNSSPARLDDNPPSTIIENSLEATDPAVFSPGQRAQIAAELARLGYASAADKFLQCGKKTVAVLTCSEQVNHSARPIFEHCDNRLCPSCARRESARLVAHYSKAVEKRIDDHSRRGYRLRHLVLTTDIHPLDANAKERYENVRRQIEHTLRDCICPLKYGETARAWRERWRLKKQTIGAIIVDEFGEQGHRLHFHVTYYGPFIPQDELRQKWERHTGYSIVYITSRQDQPLEDVLRETLKYVTKFAVDGQATSPAILAHIYDILAGRRRVRTWGLFYNLPPELEEETDHGQCPECQAALQPLELGKFFEHVNTLITADEDLSEPVVRVLAYACLSASESNQFTARRQWAEIWQGFSDGPGYEEFAQGSPDPPDTPP